MNPLPVVSSSTKLRIFGVPSHLQQGLKKLFEQVGPVTYFEPGPIESNYVILAFANPAHALRALRQSGELIYNGCYLGVKEIGGDEIDLGAARREENVEMESEDMQVDSSASEPQMVQIRNNASAPSSSRLPQSQSSFALSSGIETLQPRRTDSPFRIQAANNATRKQGSRQSQIQPEFSFGTVQPVQPQNGQQQQQQQQQQGHGSQGGLKPSTSMRFMGMFADALVSSRSFQAERKISRSLIVISLATYLVWEMNDCPCCDIVQYTIMPCRFMANSVEKHVSVRPR